MLIKKFENYEKPLTGWVNIKIDRQLYIRMHKYVSSLDKIIKDGSRFKLIPKLKVLSNLDSEINKHPELTIQDKISLITLLQYLNEIKSNFNPSSAGFLFEGYIATLVHGLIKEGTKVADAVVFNDGNETFQIKLYGKDSGTIKVNMKKLCDYYIIGIKESESIISVYVLSPNENSDGKYIFDENILQVPKNKVTSLPEVTGKILTTKQIQGLMKFSYNKGESDNCVFININKLMGRTDESQKSTIEFSDDKINGMIRSIGDNIQDSLEKTFKLISDLEYDVESLVTGVTPDKVEIKVDDAKSKCDLTLREIQTQVKELSTKMK